MHNILIEVSHEDQIFVENECTNKGYTLSIFFKNMLESYKKEGEWDDLERFIPPKEEVKEKAEPKKTKKKDAK